MFEPREPLIGEEIQLEGRIWDDVVPTKKNGVFAMFSVDGVYPDTADEHDLVAWFEQFHNAQKSIQAEDVELFVYRCHGEVDPEDYRASDHATLFEDFDPTLSQALDDAYRERLFAETLYINRLYLGILIHAPSITTQSISRFFSEDTDPRAGINRRRTRLDEICNLLQAQLSNFGLRRLGYDADRVPGLLFDEIAEALAFAGTGLERQIGATTGRLGNAIFSEDIHFRPSNSPKWIEFEQPAGTTCGVIYDFKDYPASTAPWMLDALSVAPYRCTLAQSYRFLSNAAAVAVVGRKQNKMLISGDKANDQIEELDKAQNRLLNREFVLGEHSLVLLAFANSRRNLSAVSNAAWRDLTACAITAKRVTRILQAAYLSIFPGNSHLQPRPVLVSSINFCAFAPLYNWPSGSETGQWPGREIALFRTLAGTPYRFHWHGQTADKSNLVNGNTLVTGDSGSGKTTGVGALIAFSASRARIIALDHKRGWQFLFPRLHGSYAALGAGEPHLAPLKALDGTPRNLEFLTELIRGCIGGIILEEESRRLSLGLQTVMQLPPEERSISELCAFFDSSPEGAGARLAKWRWPDGELGWVIDAPKDSFSLTDRCCYDTTDLLDNERASGPALSYIFHRISLALDGRPLLLPFDEGWRALKIPTFRNMIEKQVRTIRSKGGVVVFITQSPSDITDSEIVRVLVEQCPTQIHFANPRGTKADYVDGLHLTQGQFEAFHQLQGGQGLFLLVQGKTSIIAQMPMHGLPEFLPILSAPERDLQSGAFPEFKEAAE